MAEDVGRKLLGEVEEMGLDELLHSIRIEQEGTRNRFNLPPIDDVLHAISQGRPAIKNGTSQPIIELMSFASGGGKTHLLYLLCALAVLPTSDGGRQGCVVVLDLDGRFAVSRLATQIRKMLQGRHQRQSDITDTKTLNEDTVSALRHIHIFRPQSLASTAATLNALSTYLFNRDCHYSYDRQVAFIAIDPATTFYWQDRAETADAAFTASTTTSPVEARTAQAQAHSGYAEVSIALIKATEAFHCPAIITSWCLSPIPSGNADTRSLRPQLPIIQHTLRLVVYRLPVRKFQSAISVQQALRETPDRQKAVDEGKFECFINEWGIEDRLARESRNVRKRFSFRIREEGITVDTEDQAEEQHEVD